MLSFPRLLLVFPCHHQHNLEKYFLGYFIILYLQLSGIHFTIGIKIFVPVMDVGGYAFPIILEKDALVFGGALNGSSISPPSSWSRISASARRFLRCVPNFSVEETAIEIKNH